MERDEVGSKNKLRYSEISCFNLLTRENCCIIIQACVAIELLRTKAKQLNRLQFNISMEKSVPFYGQHCTYVGNVLIKY